MNVQEILTYPAAPQSACPTGAGLPHTASLPRLLSTMTGESAGSLAVDMPEAPQRSLTAWQLLQSVAKLLWYSDEISDIELRCPTRSYSASALTLAAEDADAPVLSLLAYPAGEGMLDVYMRVGRSDPSAAVRSLERHGFSVTRAGGAEYADAELSRARIQELQHYLSI